MNSTRNLSIWSDLRPYSIGFEDIFRHFDLHLDTKSTTFPPYNIVKTGENQYDVELALAGFNKKDIDVTVEDGILTIKSIVKDSKEDKEEGVIHKGIAKRYFSKSFKVYIHAISNVMFGLHKSKWFLWQQMVKKSILT